MVSDQKCEWSLIVRRRHGCSFRQLGHANPSRLWQRPQGGFSRVFMPPLAGVDDGFVRSRTSVPLHLEERWVTK
jgi:hypothetical protein